MSVESLANYESWDLRMNQLPKRSHLYSLQPIGFGTPTVESFTSYLQRLAAAHGVSIASLIRYKITPLFIQSNQPPDFLKADDAIKMLIDAWHREPALLQQQSAKFWLDRTHHVSKVVAIVEKLTARRDLSFLTLLQWHSWRLNFNHIFHTEQRWCSGCYQDWREAGLPIYHPLLWTIEAVSVCPVHQRYLQLRCLYCGYFQKFLDLECHSLGYCCACNAWLGRFFDNTAKSQGSRFDWDKWAAQSVGLIFGALPTFSSTSFYKDTPIAKYPRKPTLTRFLRWCYKLGINPVEGLEIFSIIPSVLN
ncbi:TniQ family protein [Nostocales cyanobacterium LEGE 12452]|nr:TniQ family protein [Nostocales cyanobacterium LEGE 12452]